MWKEDNTNDNNEKASLRRLSDLDSYEFIVFFTPSHLSLLGIIVLVIKKILWGGW